MEVTRDQIEFFERNGYLVVERITTGDEVARLRDVYDRLFAERAGEADGAYFDLAGPKGHDGEDVLPQILSPETRAPELDDTTYVRNASALATHLLGEDPVHRFGHMILKPAGFGRETPWHQDEAYWDPRFEHRGLSIWMPLEDATIESGCMQFVPGSHLERIVTHRHIDDDPSVHGLETTEADTSSAVACPVPAGGATVHHCRILHYAGPNRTDRPRRAWIQVFNAAARVRDVPDERPWR